MRSYFVLGVLIMLMCSCMGRYTPPVLNAAFSDAPPPPDYSLQSSWASLPEITDPADKVPGGSWLPDNQHNASADVFFVHPTSYLKHTALSKAWNADISDKVINDETDKGSILYQASVFNSAGRIFSPRYRQAFIYSYWTEEMENASKAFDLAYADVKEAFEYYLGNYNNGRPIIVASHSQGTTHAIRLLKEFFDGKELSSRLVCAYLVGMPVYDTMLVSLKPCNDSLETGCYTSWRTYAVNYFPPGYHKPEVEAVCTNPLSWTTGDEYMSFEFNKGGILRNFDKVIKNLCDAQVKDGVVRIHEPRFRGRIFFNFKNYHIVDYNLFYMNIRENAVARSREFLKHQVQK